MRLTMARTSVTGVAYAPVLIVITPVIDWPNVDIATRHRLEHQISGLLAMHPEIVEQVRRIAAMAQ